MNDRARVVLALDTCAGVTVGLLVLALHGWVAELYGFTPALVALVGGANVTYASYSGTLALRAAHGRAPSRPAVLALVAANSAWIPVCLGLIAHTWPTATAFGLAHLAAEALFVGTLAVLEVRFVLPPRRVV